MSKYEEKVWVVADEELCTARVPLGAEFTSDREAIKSLWGALDTAMFMERSQVENDPTYKQIIPYVVVSSGKRLLTYRRAGSEGRLTGKISFGVGGHINPCDSLRENNPPMMVVLSAADRELNEELYLEDANGKRASAIPLFRGKTIVKGILYYDSDAVGRVHLGLVIPVDLPWGVAQGLRLSSENKDMAWEDPDDLVKDPSSLETWSQVCLDAIAAGKLLRR